MRINGMANNNLPIHLLGGKPIQRKVIMAAATAKLRCITLTSRAKGKRWAIRRGKPKPAAAMGTRISKVSRVLIKFGKVPRRMRTMTHNTEHRITIRRSSQ